MTLAKIYECSPVEVDNWLRSCSFLIPTSVDTVQEAAYAGKMMAELVNWESYLAQMLGSLKYLIRDAKNQQNQRLANDLIDKKEMISLAMNSAKSQRETISRMVSIKSMINEELKHLNYV